MPFMLEEFHGESISSVVATGESLMDVIVCSLGWLTTREIHELQTIYLPRARLIAVECESRTPPVRLHEPTVAVPASEIRRSTRDAAAAVMDDGAPD